MTNYFLNLLRPNTPRPTKPEPSSKSVAGSGVARGAPPVEDPSAVAIDVEVVEVRLDPVAGLSDEFSGQPAIPKNIIRTHKTINNFFKMHLSISIQNVL
jgi:hypothetical protein